jgi:leader peptidase (prepilin peptidase)/N-methyltransferase
MIDQALFANADTLSVHVALTLWLLPCALCDLRSRRVPNWLTLPALGVALCWAAHTGTLALSLTVLFASYLAFLTGGMGGADGKIATVQAAISPPALLIAGILLLVTFLGLRLKRSSHRPLPAGLWFFAGALLSLPINLIPATLTGGIS